MCIDPDCKLLSSLLGWLVDRVQTLVDDETAEILSDSTFQALRSRWLALGWLCDVVHGECEDADGGVAPSAALEVLDLSREELFENLVHDVGSNVVRRVCYKPFDTPGNYEVYGLILVDGEFDISADAEAIQALSALAREGSECLAPVIAAVSWMALVGEDGRLMSGQWKREREWKRLRSQDSARFLGLVVPRMVVPSAGTRTLRSGEEPAWISAAWGFVAVVVRAWRCDGWFTDIRGARRSEHGARSECGAGIVPGLTPLHFGESEPWAFCRGPTDMMFSPAAERYVVEKIGLIPLVATSFDGRAAFYTNQSIQRHRGASDDERIEAMLQYTLCACRVAHSIRRYAEEHIVAAQHEVGDIGRRIQERCIELLCDDDAGAIDKRRKPLRRVAVAAKEIGGGRFDLDIVIVPHPQLDDLEGAVRLRSSCTMDRRR